MSASRARRVLIAGGGIGGIAAALALQQRGIECAVFESAPELRDGGAGLHIWTNGMLALEYLGLAEKVRETAPAQDICSFADWRGRSIGDWPVGEFVARYGQPTVAIGRSQLHGIMRDALTTPVRTGAQVTGYVQDGTGVTVRFADGSEERGDVLVGADGIHSAVRAQLRGPQPPHYTGYIAWRGHAHLGPEEIAPGSFLGLFGRGTRFTYYDIAPGVVHWMSVANGPAGGRDQGTGEDTLRMLRSRHRGWVDPVSRILEATDPDSIIRNDVIERRPDSVWGEGRVTLLGDAAHAVSFNIGQGACLAVEDALVLAEHLTRKGDVGAALRGYESERQVRTAPMQVLASRIGRVGALENPLAVWVRDKIMKAAWTRVAFAAAEKEHVAYGTRWRSQGRSLQGQN
ncbi:MULTISPECIES: FAD-dependent oxidoreductase [Streptomyces]|uniref:FAD-dependent oxidoreductase n=1 Tax=Streptomyces eurythermus TaxID=42237 RepID=A0ABW6Z4W9_9ACTN|nr:MULTISPECIES: FAD-dependent monooxygenase [Streptomyces]QIS74058.1 FAD-binding protein [Streptomyces sp. DSM 40868]WDM16584.1 FAD-dependent monooxygenase [Streptomyces lavenduligriseus]